MPDYRILVVGTTPDYIAYINERYPGRALFLTDRSQRNGAAEAAPEKNSEIICQLENEDDLLNKLHRHLEAWDQSLSGIVCYDCEWLILSTRLARHFGLPYPSEDSVRISRDKFKTKQKWLEHGVRCPQVQLINHAWQTANLIKEPGQSFVIKPLSGTGSELTFHCVDKYDLMTAYSNIMDGLAARSMSSLYKSEIEKAKGNEDNFFILAEEFIEGREYSADFIVDNDQIIIIRVAKKIRDNSLPFGTTMAYVVPARLPGWLSYDQLSDKFRHAAGALGLTRAICMVDFIVSKNEIVFLELTPRIGGDCLPPLIRHSCGLDTIGLALDFAEGKKTVIPALSDWTELVGLRLFSSRGGELINIDYKKVSKDSRVKDIFIKHRPGHNIILPPDDYDSWILGQIIFEPFSDISIEEQCHNLRGKIEIDVELCYDQKIDWSFRKSG